jgi:hypothetical protein
MTIGPTDYKLLTQRYKLLITTDIQLCEYLTKFLVKMRLNKLVAPELMNTLRPFMKPEGS